MKSNNLSRRTFMKTASATTTGLLIMAGKAPFSYALNDKVKVGCIGCGGQGSYHIKDGLMGASDIVITAVCDAYGPHQRLGILLAQISNAGIAIEGTTGLTDEQKERAKAAFKPKGYYDYREMLEKEDLDAVVIATPLHMHYPMIMDSLSAGKYVFCEKTMCYDIEQARDVVKKCHETGKWVQVGHQRRYNPLYNKAVMMAWEEGTIGRIVHIDAQWHRNNDWRRPVNKDHKLNSQEARFIKDLERYMNWRLYKESSRGLVTELATHQLDIAAWFLDAMPRRVYGCGSLDYWRDGREVHDSINLIYEFDITPENRGYRAINARSKYQDKMAINQPYTVQVVYSSITANAKKGCSELIQGDEGTFELSEEGGYFYPEATAKVSWGESASAEQTATVITSGGTLKLSNKALQQGQPIVVDNTRSVDQLQFIRFAKDIKEGGVPKANQMVGLRATIMALAGYMAIEERRMVEIDPAWYTFDFPTPDPSMVG